MALDPIFKICLLASVLVFANSVEALSRRNSNYDDHNFLKKVHNKFSKIKQFPMYQNPNGLNYNPLKSRPIYTRGSRNFYRRRLTDQDCPCAPAVQANFARHLAMSLLDSLTSDDFNAVYTKTPRASDRVRADIVRDLMAELMDKLLPADKQLFQAKLLDISKLIETNEDSTLPNVDNTITTDDIEEDNPSAQNLENLLKSEAIEGSGLEEIIDGTTSDVLVDEDINGNEEPDLENKIPTNDEEKPLDENGELKEPEELTEDFEAPVDGEKILEDDNDAPIDVSGDVGIPENLEGSVTDDDESISDNTVDQTKEEPEELETKEVDDIPEGDDELSEEKNLDQQELSAQDESLNDYSQLENQLGNTKGIWTNLDRLPSQPLQGLDILAEDNDNRVNRDKRKRKRKRLNKKRKKRKRKRQRYPLENSDNDFSILHYGTSEGFDKTKRPQWSNDLRPQRPQRKKKKKGKQPVYSQMPNLTNQPQYPHPMFSQYGSDYPNFNPSQSPQQAVLPQDIDSLIPNRKHKKKKKKKKHRLQKGSLANISQFGDLNSPDRKKKHRKKKKGYPRGETGAELAEIDEFGSSTNRTKSPQWPNAQGYLESPVPGNQVPGQGFDVYIDKRKKSKLRKKKKGPNRGPMADESHDIMYGDSTNPSISLQNTLMQSQQTVLPEDNLLNKKQKPGPGIMQQESMDVSQSRQTYYGLPSDNAPFGTLSDSSPDSYAFPSQAMENLDAQPDTMREMGMTKPQEETNVDSNTLYNKTPEDSVHQVANLPSEGLDMIKRPQRPYSESPFQTAATATGQEFDDDMYTRKKLKTQDGKQDDYLSSSAQYPGAFDYFNNQPQYITHRVPRPYENKQDGGMNFNQKKRKRPKRKHRKKKRKKGTRQKKDKNGYSQTQGIELSTDLDDGSEFGEDGRLTDDNQKPMADTMHLSDQPEIEGDVPENSYENDNLDSKEPPSNLLLINKESFDNFLELAVQLLQNVSRSDLFRIIPNNLLSSLMSKPNSILTDLLNNVLIKLQGGEHENELYDVPTLLLSALHNNDLQEQRNPSKRKDKKIKLAVEIINNNQIGYESDSEQLPLGLVSLNKFLNNQRGPQIDINNDGSTVELLYEDAFHTSEKENHNVFHDTDSDSELADIEKVHGGSKFQITPENSLRKKENKKRLKKKKGAGIKDLIKNQINSALLGSIEDEEKAESVLDHINLHTDSELSETTKISGGPKVKLILEDALPNTEKWNRLKKKKGTGVKDLANNEYDNELQGPIENEEQADSDLDYIDLNTNSELSETTKMSRESKIELMHENALQRKKRLKKKKATGVKDLAKNEYDDELQGPIENEEQTDSDLDYIDLNTNSESLETTKMSRGSKIELIHENALQRKKRLKKKKTAGVKDLANNGHDSESQGLIEKEKQADSDSDYIDLNTNSELSETTKMSTGSKIKLIHENALQRKKRLKKKKAAGVKDLAKNEYDSEQQGPIENEKQADTDLNYIDLNTNSELSGTTKMSTGSKIKLIHENALQRKKRLKKKKAAGVKDLENNEYDSESHGVIENEKQADTDLNYIDLNTNSELSGTTKMSTGSKIKLIHENALQRKKRLKKKMAAIVKDLENNEYDSESQGLIENEEQADSDSDYIDLNTNSEVSETTKMSGGSKLELIHENALRRKKRLKKKKAAGIKDLTMNEYGSESQEPVENEEQTAADLEYLDLNTNSELSETTKMSGGSKLELIHENALQKKKRLKKKKATAENKDQADSDLEYIDLNTDSELSETTKTSKKSKVELLKEDGLELKLWKKAKHGQEIDSEQTKEFINQTHNKTKFELMYEDALQVFERKNAHTDERNFENTNRRENSNISEMERTFNGSEVHILHEDSLQTKGLQNSKRENTSLERENSVLFEKKGDDNFDSIDIEADYELSETEKISDGSKMEITYEDALEITTQQKSMENDLEIVKDIDYDNNSEISESKEDHNENLIELIYEDAVLIKHATKPERDIAEESEMRQTNEMYRNARPLIYRKKRRKLMKSGRNLRDFQYRGNNRNLPFSTGSTINYISSNEFKANKQANLRVIEESANSLESNFSENQVDANDDNKLNNGVKFVPYGQDPTPQLTKGPHYTNMKKVEDYFPPYKISQNIVQTDVNPKPLLNQILEEQDENNLVYRGKIKIIE